MDQYSDEHGDREELCEDEALLLTQFAVDHAPDAIFWIDENARFSYVNEAACRSLEYSCEELLGLTVPEIDPTWPMGKWEAMWEDLKKQGSNTFETVHQTKHGRIFPVEIRANFIEYRGKSMDCAYARDISERKKAEETLRFIQYALDRMSDAALLVMPTGHFSYANKAARDLLGYSEEELLGMTVVDINVDIDAAVWSAHWDEMRQKRTMTIESPLKAKDGHLVPAEIRINFVEFEGREYHYTFVRDITERKQAEEALRKANRALAALSRVNEILVRAGDESELLRDVCQAVVEAGGYRMAWVGFAEDDDAKTIRPVAHAGHEDGYLDRAGMTWAGDERGQCPAGTAIRTKKMCIVSDVLAAPSYSPWRESAVTRGYGCSISLPLIAEGRAIGALSLYATEPGCLDPSEEGLLSQLASDLSYGIASLRAREEHRAAEAERRALEQRLEVHKRRFYRETILSVTSGKLDVCEPTDLKPYLTGARTKFDVREPADVGEARAEVQAFCLGHGLSEPKLSAFLIGVGEAMTNSLKHADGSRVYMGTTDGAVWVGVKDRGPGIASLILPRAVLWRGFSTKPSLGIGYTIMLDVADRILLRTSTHGTTVLLVKSLTDIPPTSGYTWDAVPDMAK